MAYWFEVLIWLIITFVGIFIMTNVVNWLDSRTKSLPMPLAIILVVGTFLLVIALQNHFV